MYTDIKKFIHLSDEIIAAKKKNQPIVALESTIITHGMPAPDNYEIALEAEHLIRRNGCVPATIAILDGKIKFKRQIKINPHFSTLCNMW